MQKKPWYQSKTIQANVILGIIAAILATPELADFITILPEASREFALRLLPLVAAVVNVYLRFVTSQPIGAPGAGSVESYVEATRRLPDEADGE